MIALKRSVLTMGRRLVWVLRRFNDSFTLGNKPIYIPINVKEKNTSKATQYCVKQRLRRSYKILEAKHFALCPLLFSA